MDTQNWPAMPPTSPFHPDNKEGYLAWRELKLETSPQRVDELVVEVKDPRRLSDSEYQALLDRCRRANMAVYASRVTDPEDKEHPRRLGLEFGLQRLDHNACADEDAITSLKVVAEPPHQGYIPYTDRPIAWHTDGYYNTPDHQVRAIILHCVQPAAEGGGNQLLDHEMAYLLLRDQNPEHIRALLHPQAMTIPANQQDGKILRPEQSGPVFSLMRERLHMRYTARARNIRWREDAATHAAVSALEAILKGGSAWHLEARLERGQGLLANNVLHTRGRFQNGARERLLYRARYHDRIEGT